MLAKRLPRALNSGSSTSAPSVLLYFLMKSFTTTVLHLPVSSKAFSCASLRNIGDIFFTSHAPGCAIVLIDTPAS
jgi:hypothetical protein